MVEFAQVDPSHKQKWKPKEKRKKNETERFENDIWINWDCVEFTDLRMVSLHSAQICLPNSPIVSIWCLGNTVTEILDFVRLDYFFRCTNKISMHTICFWSLIFSACVEQ